jgi:hypothetical protein
VKPWWLLSALAMTVDSAHAAEDPSVPTYTATYRVEYKGKEAGTAEFSVRYHADRDVYEFDSRALAKGLVKLARPNPTVERSEFRIEDGEVRPLRFWYEDGSRSGEDNFDIVFDWDRHVATVSTSAARREVASPEGTVDRGSAQVALMRDLAAGREPQGYTLLDDDSVAKYDYTDGGTETLATAAGSFATKVLIQQRPGSSRVMRFWLAPELRFLPVKIEQRRNGEPHSAFALVSVTGITAAR